MAEPPDPLQQRKPKRRLGGYERADVDRLLEDLERGYEQVCAERNELQARLETAEQELSRYAELERVLRESIITAQQAAADLAERSAREAEATVEKAQSLADELVEKARATQERLQTDARRKAGEILREARDENARLRTEIAELELVKKELHASTRAFLRSALDIVEQGDWRLNPASDGLPSPHDDGSTSASDTTAIPSRESAAPASARSRRA